MLPFEGRSELPGEQQLSSSTVIDRRVFTKPARDGSDNVRKDVAIRTDKHEDNPDHPPYVVFYTDCAAGRKDPLKTALKVAGTREGLELHVEAWLEANVRKGWAEVGGEQLPGAASEPPVRLRPSRPGCGQPAASSGPFSSSIRCTHVGQGRS